MVTVRGQCTIYAKKFNAIKKAVAVHWIPCKVFYVAICLDYDSKHSNASLLIFCASWLKLVGAGGLDQMWRVDKNM